MGRFLGLENIELIYLNDYETKQIYEIKQWKKEEPGVVSLLKGRIVKPFKLDAGQVDTTAAIEAALKNQ
jgi:hypothetical protein